MSSLSVDGLKNYPQLSGLSFILKLVECVVAEQTYYRSLVYALKHYHQSPISSTEVTVLLMENKIKFIYSWLEENLSWYDWTSELLLIPLITQLCSVAYSLHLVCVVLSSSGSFDHLCSISKIGSTFSESYTL